MAIFARIIAAVVLAAVTIITLITGSFHDPFNGPLDTAAWCPGNNADAGCHTIQPATAGGNRTLVFDPRQVTFAHGDMVFTIVHNPWTAPDGSVWPYRSGSINGHYKQAYGYGWFSARVHLDCTNRLVDDWPALWIQGTVGPWPLRGEIDIMEGLKGHPAWHYHYLDASGHKEQFGGKVAGNFCGWDTFGVNREPGYVTWFYNHVEVGKVTAADIGVPLATDPMFPIIDLNGSLPGFCCGGPFVTGPRMIVDYFRHSSPRARHAKLGYRR